MRTFGAKWVLLVFASLASLSPARGMAENPSAHSEEVDRNTGNRSPELMEPREAGEQKTAGQARIGAAAASLESALRSADPRTRAIAAERLILNGEPVNSALLVGLLLDEDPAVRRVALETLEAADSANLCERILEAYSRQDAEACFAYGGALPTLRGKLEPMLLEILASEAESSRRRTAAALCLADMGSRQAASLLAQLVWTSDETLALGCATALVRIPYAGLLKDFIGLTGHRQPEVRMLAVQGLAQLGGPEAAQALECVAVNRSERSAAVRAEAIAVLALVGEQSSAPALIEIMRSSVRFRRLAGASLRQLTGQSFGDRPEPWLEWHAAVRQFQEGKESSPPPLVPRPALLPAVPPGFTPGRYPPEEKRSE